MKNKKGKPVELPIIDKPTVAKKTAKDVPVKNKAAIETATAETSGGGSTNTLAQSPRVNGETTLSNAIYVQTQHIGVSLDKQSLAEVGQDLRAINFILQDAGLEIKDVARPVLSKSAWPMLLRLKNDTWIVLLEIRDGQAILADPQVADGFIEYPYEDLKKNHANAAYTIRKSLQQASREQVDVTQTGHWFWSRVCIKKSPLGSVILGSFVANVLGIVISLFSLQVYDRVIPNQSLDTLWVLFIGVFIAMIFEALLRIARTNILDHTGREVDTELSMFLLRRLCSLKLTPKLPHASRLSQVMREFGSIREFVTEAAVGAMVDIPFSIIFFVLIWFIAGPVVWVSVVAVVLMMVPSFLFRKRMLAIAGESLGSQTASGRVFNEIAYSLETVKVARAESFFLEQWKSINRLINDTSAKQRRLMSNLTQWSSSIIQLSYAFTVVYAVYRVFDGHLTVGAIIATTMLSSRAVSPLARFSTLLMRWHQVKRSLAELNSLVELDSNLPTDRVMLTRNRAPGQIRLNEVVYNYSAKGEAALQIPFLQINVGEKVAILGPNGSGKSTLLRVISGVYEPTQGNVTLDGTDMRQIDSHDLRRAMGFLPQDAILYRGTLRDNLKLSRKNIEDQQILNVLEFTGLGPLVRNHPEGLQMQITDGGSGLSSGQRQSVGLARMLLSDPGMVLLDEPTANLDPEAEIMTIKRLGSWLSKRTLVVATHRMPILSLVDRIIVMANGRISIDGPRDEVLKKLEEIKNTLNNQPKEEQRKRVEQQR